MKFTIQKSLIQQGLEKASKGVAKSQAQPIFNGILLQVTEEEIILTGASYDTSIKVVLEVDNEETKVEVPGATVLQIKALDIVKKLKDGEVIFETDDKDLTTISTNSVEFELPGQVADEFPKLPGISKDNRPIITFKGKEFQDIARKTTFCASTSDNRPILQAVMFDIKSDCSHFISTDVSRIGFVSISSSSKDQEEIKMPIPSKAVVEMTKVFDFNKDVELFSLSETQAVLRNGNTIFTSRLLEGKYPVTKELIPTQSTTKITVNRKEFEQALEQMSVLVEDGNTSSVVKMTIEGLMFSLQSSASQKGKGKVDVPYVNFEGEPLVIGYSGKFALDGIKSFQSDEIDIRFGGAQKPILITPTGDIDFNLDCLYMLSPVRMY